jgi:diacylglycerol kinase (ATP)
MHATIINLGPHPFMSTPVPTKRTGLSRVLHAFTYSIDGLRTGWQEPAFRQEAVLAIPLVPLAFVIGANWMETAMLVAVVILVMVTELLNTAVESAIDRIGPEWHAISKRAKDLGSAAVLLSLLLCGGVWLAALWAWW